MSDGCPSRRRRLQVVTQSSLALSPSPAWSTSLHPHRVGSRVPVVGIMGYDHDGGYMSTRVQSRDGRVDDGDGSRCAACSSLRVVRGQVDSARIGDLLVVADDGLVRRRVFVAGRAHKLIPWTCDVPREWPRARRRRDGAKTGGEDLRGGIDVHAQVEQTRPSASVAGMRGAPVAKITDVKEASHYGQEKPCAHQLSGCAWWRLNND
ncbi:hypothetical protein C8Q74DRAFT_916978 [Fomes fomentarius]|nr:hypothetical protein C8Q74DRAFT_916978 [Fomes fomentarius]